MLILQHILYKPYFCISHMCVYMYMYICVYMHVCVWGNILTNTEFLFLRILLACGEGKFCFAILICNKALV